MNLLNRELIEVVIDHALQNDLLRGHFGLEKEMYGSTKMGNLP
ncbi:Uncharacterised protein [Actinobacillus pleuropneumoniae]|nr:Uncharacterised protein [Actinobacillus pleuropneumoniae]